MSKIFPEDLDSWVHCIQVSCGIELNKDFVSNRISILSEIDNPETKKFIERYGSQWHERILSYYVQTLSSL